MVRRFLASEPRMDAYTLASAPTATRGPEMTDIPDPKTPSRIERITLVFTSAICVIFGILLGSAIGAAVGGFGLGFISYDWGIRNGWITTGAAK